MKKPILRATLAVVLLVPLLLFTQNGLATNSKDLRPMELREFSEQKSLLRALWLEPRVVAIHHHFEGAEYWLHAGNVYMENGVVRSDRAFRMMPSGRVSDRPDLSRRFPYLHGYTRLENEALAREPLALLKKDLLLVVQTPEKRTIFVTGVQLHPIIDLLTVYAGDDLGVRFGEDGRPTIKLWAPTAQSVKLYLFKNAKDEDPFKVLKMHPDTNGVWSKQGDASWKGLYYLYEVHVFVPKTGKYEQNVVTDPYSFALATNSTKSQIVDINAPEAKPDGWESILKPALPSPTDMSIYELHVRDFSAMDQSVPEERRGTFLAFAEPDSHGVRHLRDLARSGLTHIHLLPVFDFTTVNEDRSQRKEPQIPQGLPGDSPIPQQLVFETRTQDGFNWGYDPYHYFAPEGSYATQPDGLPRIREFREMVKGLHQLGLRVIMDVVFNHVFQGGQDPYSVLDKIVPNYYQRVGLNGVMEISACGGCADTATEHLMMEKLMIDAIVHWVKHYKVDGFRFDLMGFHTIANMQRIRAALDALTLQKDGVDGKGVYLYGEGWKFGSLDAILGSETATQHNVFGTGIGTFNDRIRDRIRGGDFRAETKADQGFATGLYYDDNGLHPHGHKFTLLKHTDSIRIGMTGNLRDYRMKNSSGYVVRGAEVDYNGSPTGYTAQPSEVINFVSAHDNMDLWDHVQSKAPFHKPGRHPETATNEERSRMQRMALGLIALGQGIPFFHAGSEILRSKSGDHNSYNSGDWFNRIDYSYQTNNWGVGLPPATDNRREWDFLAPRLRDSELMTPSEYIVATKRHFMGVLKVRKSSRLFRLNDANEVQARLHFLETDYGEQQPPGLIAMMLRDDLPGHAELDPERSAILALFNATLAPVEFSHDALKGRRFQLHRDWTIEEEPRVLEAKFDATRGTVVVPAQSIIVFEERR